MNIDSFAIGAPNRIGNTRFSEKTPGTIGDVVEHQAALVEGDGGDITAVRRPARREKALGAGDGRDGVAVHVENLNGAGAGFFTHEVRDATEDERLSVGGPVGVTGVAILRMERLWATAFGRDGVELPRLARLACHDGDLLPVRRPMGK